MDGAIRRSDLTGISIRPSWVQWEGNYAGNLGPALRDPENSPSASLWAYIDAYDLADAMVLAATSDTPGHEVIYIASPDNHANRPLRRAGPPPPRRRDRAARDRPRGRVGHLDRQGPAR